VLKDERIIGAVLYGDTADGAVVLRHAQEARQSTSREMRDTLIFGQAYQGGAPLDPTAAVAALPDEAEICGCNGVCKGKITGAITGKGLTGRSTTCAPTPRPRRAAARAPGWSSSC
jgi:nitrite reductase (NADH) large subunit